MKDLSGRFADEEGQPPAEARSDPLLRLQQPPPDEAPDGRDPLRRMRDAVRGRTGVLTALPAALAAALLLWPLLAPPVVPLPPVAETGDEVALLTVRPLANVPALDWYGLFNAYQLETSLRDISIRCNYSLPVDARVDRYLHAPLADGTTIRIFLADPGTCPRL